MADAPDALFRAPISNGAKTMGALLWRFAPHGAERPFVWPSTSTLAELTGQSRQAVSKQLGILRKAGLIKHARRPIDGRWLDGWVLSRATSVDAASTTVVADGNDGCGVGATTVDSPSTTVAKPSTTVSEGDNHGCTEAPLKPHESPLNPSSPVPGAGSNVGAETDGGGGRQSSAHEQGHYDPEAWDDEEPPWDTSVPEVELLSRPAVLAGMLDDLEPGVIARHRGFAELAWRCFLEARGVVGVDLTFARDQRVQLHRILVDGVPPSRVLRAVEAIARDPWWRGDGQGYARGKPPRIESAWAKALSTPATTLEWAGRELVLSAAERREMHAASVAMRARQRDLEEAQP